MKRLVIIALVASAVFAQEPADRAALDAAVVDRVAEASKRDLPRDLLKRIVEEDLELLRGRRPDGSYEFATYERLESGRVEKSFSVQPRADKMDTIELRGANIYRVIIDIPSRRLLVRRNRPVWIERVDVDFVAQGETANQQKSFEVKAWMQPGETRPIDLPAIARQATARVVATADKEGGYGNLDIALVQARIVDLSTSPYAEAVTSAKALLRALGDGEINAVRSHAGRMRDALMGSGAAGFSPPETVGGLKSTAPQAAATDGASRLEMQTELQMIEDLLTGSDTERREGLDRLHQLIRRLRQ